jgi:hypothetical protein
MRRKLYRSFPAITDPLQPTSFGGARLMVEHGKLTIILHSGQRYEMAYKHREELLNYFADPQVPRFIFETTDGLWVYLQKGAIAAIEAAAGPDRSTIEGFAVLGQDRK